MHSLASVNRLHKERFECHECEKTYSDDEVRNTWKCPDWGAYIHVYAEDEETNTKIVLIRKRASEVEEGDLVHLPGGLTNDPYLVLGVNDLGSKLGIRLKDYGQYKVAPDGPINCRTGAW